MLIQLARQYKPFDCYAVSTDHVYLLHDPVCMGGVAPVSQAQQGLVSPLILPNRSPGWGNARSEEHTSELQSQR